MPAQVNTEQPAETQAGQTATEAATTQQADDRLARMEALLEKRLSSEPDATSAIAESDDLETELGPRAAAVIRELKQSFSNVTKSIESSNEAARRERNEAAIDSLADENIKSSPASRAKVLRQVEILERGYQATGEKLPSRSELVRQAIAAVAPTQTSSEKPAPVASRPGASEKNAATSPEDVTRRNFSQRLAQIRAGANA